MQIIGKMLGVGEDRISSLFGPSHIAMNSNIMGRLDTKILALVIMAVLINGPGGLNILYLNWESRIYGG